ncbi:YrzI family small protein [Cytobacillus oceanisediminis]
MITIIISFLFHDRYISMKEKQTNELYEKQRSFLSRVLH